MNRYRRSRFLLMHWDRLQVVVENADQNRRSRASPRLVAALASLAEWSGVEDLHEAGSTLRGPDLDYLVGLGILERESDWCAGPDPEVWTPLRLAVHRRTGSAAERPSVPAVGGPVTGGPVTDGPPVELPPPAALTSPIETILHRRRSRRGFATRPIAVAVVSSLLHHALRAQPGEPVHHPYPTSGGYDELQVYVVAARVAGMAEGTYRYDARDHALRPIDTSRDDREHRLAAVATELGRDGSATPPALLLVVTAKMTGLFERYQDLALSLVYKDVGGLTQTLHLVATALGLAGCPIGRGDDPLIGSMLGLEQRGEVSVGAFAVGHPAGE